MLYHRVGLIFNFLKNKLLVFILWPKIQDLNKFGPALLALALDPDTTQHEGYFNQNLKSVYLRS